MPKFSIPQTNQTFWKAFKAHAPQGPFPTKSNDLVIAIAGVHSMMTGVSIVRITHSGDITLTYTDGSTESRNADKWLMPKADLFSIVGYVQSGRA